MLNSKLACGFQCFAACIQCSFNNHNHIVFVMYVLVSMSNIVHVAVNLAMIDSRVWEQ